MDDFLMPYTVQMTSVVGSASLVIVPDQRSPQAPTGTHHYFPREGTYMISVAWDGPERATLTTYTNGKWWNPLRVPAGSGQRVSAPLMYSAIGANPRFAFVLDTPATAVENAVMTVIPQESFKP